MQKRGQLIYDIGFILKRDIYPKYPTADNIPCFAIYTDLKILRKKININEKMSKWENDYLTKFYNC